MKKEFEVLENESISDCLQRMEKEGYRPVRRMEKPIFKEEKVNGEIKYTPITQKIIFQGIKDS
ncbi:NETI motif-containing protein [Lederbergia graminis]|uniref:NETI motif-containing protein n=1 Tax=Lederbergia graminis TaxID=735518 RepID=A0ABW0LKM5_9BACI|nr:NETI motif-containing protein [Paenibacillus bovis]HLU24017.1 NETI motif-containing protein [Bacillaceae bacterium]